MTNEVHAPQLVQFRFNARTQTARIVEATLSCRTINEIPPSKLVWVSSDDKGVAFFSHHCHMMHCNTFDGLQLFQGIQARTFSFRLLDVNYCRTSSCSIAHFFLLSWSCSFELLGIITGGQGNQIWKSRNTDLRPSAALRGHARLQFNATLCKASTSNCVTLCPLAKAACSIRSPFPGGPNCQPYSSCGTRRRRRLYR